jgi:hypothetical protein
VGNVYSFRKLETQPQEKNFSLIEDIPSGDESDINDESENEDGNEMNQTFDINAMDIDFLADDMPVEQDWDSEDEAPLTQIQAVLIREMRLQSTTWTHDLLHTNNVQRQTFTTDTGPNVPGELETPTDVFLHLFPKTLMEHIALETNLYVLQKNGGNHSFQKTNCDEIKTFIGINLLMGIKCLLSYRDYWSSRLELRDNFVTSVQRQI